MTFQERENVALCGSSEINLDDEVSVILGGSTTGSQGHSISSMVGLCSLNIKINNNNK